VLCFGAAVSAPLPYLTQSLMQLSRSGQGQIAAHFVKQPVLFQRSLVLHAGTGGLALLLTPVLLSGRVRRRAAKLHRVAGRVGGLAVMVAALSGIVTAQVSYAGWVGRIGFTLLGVRWCQSIVMGVRAARAGQLEQHRRWAIRTAACTVSAVTLRLQLGVMIALQIPQSQGAANAAFDKVYWITAFSSWVPNVIAAEWWLHRRHRIHAVRCSP
jgi:uncharacterized membrane protein